MTLEGKGMYMWIINRCGSIGQIVSDSKKMGLSYVMIRAANGANNDNYNTEAEIQALIDALRAANIQPWIWQYVYGVDPVGEARKAIDRMNRFHPEGLIIDAETEYQGKFSQAKVYCNTLRQGLPKAQIVLSTFRFPTYFPTFPFETFLKICNMNMPQVYWIQAHNSGDQLKRCVQEYEALYAKIGTKVPIVPTGSAFTEHGWTATNSELDDFHRAAVDLASQLRILKSDNWWEFYQVQTGNYMDTIAKQTWGDVPTPPPSPIFPATITVITDSLNVRLTPNASVSTNVIGALKKGANPIAQETFTDTSGNIWARIGANLWVCMVYLNKELAKFI